MIGPQLLKTKRFGNAISTHSSFIPFKNVCEKIMGFSFSRLLERWIWLACIVVLSSAFL